MSVFITLLLFMCTLWSLAVSSLVMVSNLL